MPGPSDSDSVSPGSNPGSPAKSFFFIFIRDRGVGKDWLARMAGK
jgi:hypothetical protein